MQKTDIDNRIRQFTSKVSKIENNSQCNIIRGLDNNTYKVLHLKWYTRMCNPSKEGDYGNRGQLPSPNKKEVNQEGENGQESYSE